ncbi:MAG: hypothetical protein HYS88_00525 [Candidatus Colwellbacteria bacterium]|nr:hypothetical protein [Candidatus Colwellbacteria bacterium]
MLLGYLALAFGYGPYLKGEIKDSKAKLSALEKQVSIEDQEELVRLYSQINNIDSYDELVRQLAAYEQAPEVERTNLEGSDASGGVVRFKVSLTLKPEVFKP